MMGELWGDDAIWEQDGKLDVHIANIRRKLNKKIIETIKGFGYLLGQDDA
ncbi:MAG: winged helix-turn-helix domain-containing protein [Candidatus Peribacteria bacterium]|jgi:DNA-binding response OmpR family regulator|nr:winged helix-turn-helix domain-containing protein [Candidatus Peribacteria bacterium]